MSKEHLVLTDVSIAFPTAKGRFQALEGVNLKIEQGELVSLIGHSGCGKSTVLNIVAGLHRATRGGVILDGKEVDEPGPDRAVVFQNHSLLPWLTAYENVHLAVKQVFRGRKNRREMDDWVRHNLALVHMDHALHKRPAEISGGMKQRVGIARALAMEPRVLLMDEPFGALDALTRAHMQDSLMEIHERLRNTVILITHDVDEAVLLSDRIVMMTNGPAARIGRILDVNLARPRDRLALANNPGYNHYRAEVVHFLHERHAAGAAKPPMPVVAPGPAAAPRSGEVLDLADWRARHTGRGGRALEKGALELGFIPLTDCAPLVVAKEKGLFARHGLDVTLSRESSWANIRDKVCTGLLDGAHMLAGIPLRATAGGEACGAPMVTALSLDLNGNAITVSHALWERMLAAGEGDLAEPRASARALARVIAQDRAAGGKPLTFASVFPVSSHNYLLRYWMASAGIDPDRDVRLTVVPPPQMVNYLRAGVIAGYCVGEPWNSHAVNAGLGRSVATSYDIWNNHPEKVLGVTRAFAEANPNTHQALIMALLEAAAWLDEGDNRLEACDLLARGRYVNAPVEVLAMSMTGTYQFAADARPVARLDFNVFHRYAANFPWHSHALWILAQMRRWGQLDPALDLPRIARAVYRPDLYREAAEALGLPAPSVDSKPEGLHAGPWTLDGLAMGPDLFMDGRRFDPDDLDGYLADLDAHAEPPLRVVEG